MPSRLTISLPSLAVRRLALLCSIRAFSARIVAWVEPNPPEPCRLLTIHSMARLACVGVAGHFEPGQRGQGRGLDGQRKTAAAGDRAPGAFQVAVLGLGFGQLVQQLSF